MDFACRAVLLDADGTLVDSGAVIVRTWRVWASEYGADADAVLRVCHGRRSAETIAEFVPGDLVEPAVARLDELELADMVGVVPCAGAAELLAGLNGMPWAVVTSAISPLVRRRLAAAGLPSPEVLVTAESVTAGKPHPEGYGLAARQLGVAPRDCVVVEDAPAGVRAGRAAGCRVVAVTTTHDAAELAEADAIVPSLHEVTVGPGMVTVRGKS
jgi:sugar-phosphatase